MQRPLSSKRYPIFWSLLALFIALGLLFPKDSGGLVGLFLAFLIPFADPKVRQEKNIFVAIILALVVKELIGLVSLFIFNVVLSDAEQYHSKAFYTIVLGKPLPPDSFYGASAYLKTLYYSYRWLGPSFFVGIQISMILHSLSCSLLVRFMDLMNVRSYRPLIILLFGLCPSILIFGSTVMKEMAQLFSLLAMMYFVYDFKMRGHVPSLLGALIAGAALATLHSALSFFVRSMLPLILLWPINLRGVRISFVKCALFFGAICAAFIYFLDPVSTFIFGKIPGTWHFSDIVEQVLQYRNKVAVGRTSYPTNLGNGEVLQFFVGLGQSFAFYLVSPLPWQVRSPVDVVAFTEATLRSLLLIAAIVRTVGVGEGMYRRKMILLLVVYFLVAGFFSVGTTNFGTSFRHNMITLWMLLLVGGEPLFSSCSRVWSSVRDALRRSDAKRLRLTSPMTRSETRT